VVTGSLHEEHLTGIEKPDKQVRPGPNPDISLEILCHQLVLLTILFRWTEFYAAA
jgi:hypothetical protein